MIIRITTPWEHPFLHRQIPKDNSLIFQLDNLERDCDYWIIWGGLPPRRTKDWALCPPQNVIFMTDEVHDKKTFDNHFLRQFATVLTSRDDIEHSNVVKIHEFNHWHLNKSLIEVNNKDRILKSKPLSVVCSDLTDLPGHKKRFALVNRLIGHFKDRIDVYGRGFNPVEDKWHALAPYKYSIAIENNSHPGYFTEKLTECYLAHTLPVYYGAPDINTYFDGRSMLNIDIADYKSCIHKIEQLLEEDPYYQVENLIIQQKERYLSQYHLFPAIAQLLRKRFPTEPSAIKQKVIIRSQNTFAEHYYSRKLFKIVKNLI